MIDRRFAIDPDEFRRDSNRVTALAVSLLRDAADAQDVAQETWLAASEGRRPGGVPRRSWLVGVARNLARRFVRGETRRRKRERAVARPEAIESTVTSVERAELHRRVVDALLALEEPYRSTLAMRFFDGLSPSEIAARTATSPGTVRSRLKRGLDRLRERLDREHDGDRRAWALLLAPLGRPRPAPVALTTLAGGGLLMKATAKATVIAVTLAIVGGAALTLALLPEDVPETPPDESTGRVPGESAAPGDASRPSPAAARTAVPAVAGGSADVVVVDWSGDPIPDARVEIHARPRIVDPQASAPLERPAPVASGLSGADGHALLRGLAPGLYEAGAEAPGHARTQALFRIHGETPLPVLIRLGRAFALGGILLSGDGEPLENAIVQIGSGWPFRTRTGADGRFEIAGLSWGRCEIRAAPAGAPPIPVARVRVPFDGDLLLRLPAMGSLAGVATDAATGDPVAGVRVEVGLRYGPRRGGSATTDAEGRYRIDALPAGILMGFTAHGAGYVWRGPKRWMDSRTPIRAGEVTTRNLPLVRVEPIPDASRPAVAQAIAIGRVLDDRGRPIAGALVGSALADVNGRFRLGKLRPGQTDTWYVTAPGFVRGETTISAPAAGETTEVEIRLVPCPEVRGVLLGIDAAGIPDGAWVRAVVATGRTAPGPRGGPEVVFGPLAPVRPDGTYEADVPWSAGGRLTLSAHVRGYGQPDSPATTVEPGRRAYDVDVTLARGPTIHGRVLDAATSRPVTGALVGLTDGARPALMTATDERGRFTIRDAPPISSGKHQVVVTAPGYLNWQDTVSPADGHAEAFLVRAVLIEGRVVRADGKPVAGVRVTAGGPVPSIHADVTDADGRFVIRDLAPEAYPLHVAPTHDGVDVRKEGFEPVLAGTRDVRLVVRAAVRIEGKVLTPDGRPVTGASVRAMRSGTRGPTYHANSTGSDGGFVLRGLPPGTYDLRALPPDVGSPYFRDAASYAPGRLPGVAAGSRSVVIRLPKR